MKFRQSLDELQAEIMPGGKIPLRKIFIDGNIPKAIPPEWKSVLGKILSKLTKLNLIDSFSKAMDPLDIEGKRAKGNVRLKSDDGNVYMYNVESDTLYDANNKKLG